MILPMSQGCYLTLLNDSCARANLDRKPIISMLKAYPRLTKAWSFVAASWINKDGSLIDGVVLGSIT